MLVAIKRLLVITAGINAGLLIRDINRFPPPGELVQLTDGHNLHLDVETASIDGPSIVVGHSLGALYARGFAASHPSEVVGLGLIDPAHEHQLERLPAEVVAQMGPPSWLDAPPRAAAHLGVLRVLGPGASTTVGLPPRAEAELHAFTVTPRYLRTHLAEGRDFGRLAASVRPVSIQLPTVALSAPVALPGFEQARPAMDAMNRELAQRFPDSLLIEISGADHLSIITDHQHAANVAAVVLELRRSAQPPALTDEQDRP